MTGQTGDSPSALKVPQVLEALVNHLDISVNQIVNPRFNPYCVADEPPGVNVQQRTAPWHGEQTHYKQPTGIHWPADLRRFPNAQVPRGDPDGQRGRT